VAIHEYSVLPKPTSAYWLASLNRYAFLCLRPSGMRALVSHMTHEAATLEDMPYVIRNDDPRCPPSKPWSVVNQQTNDLRGCHPTMEHARKQQKALYASVPDARPQRSAEPEDATDPERYLVP
jgi:hypothetical protein